MLSKSLSIIRHGTSWCREGERLQIPPLINEGRGPHQRALEVCSTSEKVLCYSDKASFEAGILIVGERHVSKSTHFSSKLKVFHLNWNSTETTAPPSSKDRTGEAPFSEEEEGNTHFVELPIPSSLTALLGRKRDSAAPNQSPEDPWVMRFASPDTSAFCHKIPGERKLQLVPYNKDTNQIRMIPG